MLSGLFVLSVRRVVLCSIDFNVLRGVRFALFRTVIKVLSCCYIVVTLLYSPAFKLRALKNIFIHSNLCCDTPGHCPISHKLVDVCVT